MSMQLPDKKLRLRVAKKKNDAGSQSIIIDHCDIGMYKRIYYMASWLAIGRMLALIHDLIFLLPRHIVISKSFG